MKLWITYAWKDNAEGNFDYIVQELQKIGIEAVFDRVALIPGQRLWEQIGNTIINGNFDGWAYLITPNSLSSQPCREELEYAVNRALSSKSDKFPLIGLVNDVPFTNVPHSLKVRLCINLANANWKEEIKAGLELRPPTIISQPQSIYIWRVFEKYNGTGKSTIIEIKPRFGQVMYWRIAVPSNSTVSRWGFGPADGGDNTSPIRTSVVEGATGEINNTAVKVFGAGDMLSPNIAAKVIFDREIPEFIVFGLSSDPFGFIKNNLEMRKLR